MTTETRRTAPDATGLTRAWQDSVQALIDGYREGWQRWTEFGTTVYGMRWLDSQRAGESIERIAAGTRELASAELAVAGEWLRAPLWLTGAASPTDLQARYVRLFEAQRELARAYLDAALGWQRDVSTVAESATETAREVVDASTRTARRIANDTREAQQAGVNGVRQVAQATRAAQEQTAEAAREVVATTLEAVEATAAQAEAEARPIKGNVNARGEKIYHLPGQSNYDRTDAEERFATEEEAQAAGYRRAQTPGGGAVRGKINREGERIYHLPGQANYDRVEADMLFETEDAAREAGFRPSQR